MTRKIEPGKTDLFSIALNDGDYISGSIGYHGKINFFILNPDGTIARRLIGSSGEAKVHDGLSWRGTLADGLTALLGVH